MCLSYYRFNLINLRILLTTAPTEPEINVKGLAAHTSLPLTRELNESGVSGKPFDKNSKTPRFNFLPCGNGPEKSAKYA